MSQNENIENLLRLIMQAEEMDIDDGMKAYSRYHDMMVELSSHYNVPLPSVTGAFVALSPNSDYYGNLRSVVSMLEAFKAGVDPNRAIVSTYKHCRERAALYLSGKDFLAHTKGPKTRAFYQNILDPDKAGPVTVDGHMYWAWVAGVGTMSEALITPAVYEMIAQDIRTIANYFGVRPHEIQAILWHARKRILSIKYDPQFLLFDRDVGYQQATYRIDQLKPYGLER